MNADLRGYDIPEFDLEAFMKSITYQPEGMSMSLARQEIAIEDENWPAPVREVRILQRALELIPIGIDTNDIIAGNYGAKYADADYLKKAKEADQIEFEHSVEYKYRSEDEHIASGKYMLFGIYTPSHTTVNYPVLITKGLKYYKNQVLERKASLPENSYSAMYLDAMLESYDIVRDFASRYAELATKQRKECQDKKRRDELKKIECTLRRVPMEPAEDLFEALQAMWIIHTVTPASDRSWASTSLGNMDVYLLPYYEKWLQDGHTRDDAKSLFAAFFKLLDSYGDGSGTLNLGPNWNSLSELLLEVEKEVKYRAPIIATRMGEDTPDRIYDAIIGPELFKIGQPTFYGEKSCVEAMKYRGIMPEEIHEINSCMGMIIPGCEVADMWGCCVNMSLPLELTLNHGKPLHGELPQSVKDFTDHVPIVEPNDIKKIRRAYRQYINALVSYVADQNLKKAAWIALNRPNPFLSFITENCVFYGKDRAHSAVNTLGDQAEAYWPERDYSFEEARQGRGAKYHNVTVLAMGFAHAADAITAIEKLVFKEKKYNISELLEAACENYKGSVKNGYIYADLMHCEKYASGFDGADHNAAFVLNALADACELNYRGNIRFLPTCHTIDSNVQFGSCVYASLDGRRDGEAFGKNAGAVMYAIKNTPTDLMLGEAKLPNVRFSGGMPIDIYVSDQILGSEENRVKFRELLKTYFSLGGMQVQVNSVDVELLKKAYDEPENYPNVIVRKGGFSIYFTDLLRDVQKDMIERFEMELKE